VGGEGSAGHSELDLCAGGGGGGSGALGARVVIVGKRCQRQAVVVFERVGVALLGRRRPAAAQRARRERWGGGT